MERRDGDGGEDDLSRWFPATNPQAPSSQSPPDNNSSQQDHVTHPNPFIENNVSQNYTSPNNFSLNVPSSQNHFPGNHIPLPENYPQNLNVRYPSSQNHFPGNYLPLPENHPQNLSLRYPSSQNHFPGNHIPLPEDLPQNLNLRYPSSQNHFPGNQIPLPEDLPQNLDLRYPSSENHIPLPENHPQNLYLRYPSYQNPTQRNYILQNPNLQNPTTQDQRTNIFYPIYPYGRLWANPSFDGQSLENNSTRLSQLDPSRQHQFPSNYSYSDSSHMSDPLENQQINDLQSRLNRLKIEAVARGIDDRFIDLGLSQTNSAAFANNQYGNMPTGRRNLAAATNNRYATNNNGSSLQNGNSVRPSGIRFGLGSSINGSQSFNGSVVASSSRHNNSDARSGHYPFNSIEEVRGRIASAAKEQDLSRFLQKKLDERNPRDIEIIFSEVKEELHELMLHHVANYLIQKIIGMLNDEQMTKLIRLIVSSQQRFFRTCEDLNGSRVMQKLLDVSEYRDRRPLTADQKTLLATALKNIALPLGKTVHGYHVIQRCLQAFPSQYTKDLVEEIAENCLNLATDKSGCCLLQHCILHAQEEQKARLIADLVANALFLSEDSYGNYVVQYILGLKIPQVTNEIIVQLAGNYYTLSQGKCSSNVVEKCLRESGEEQSNAIINEIFRHPQVLELMLHSYGNYVIQSAWVVSEGRRIRQSLYNIIQMNLPFLQSHIYGKRVLATVKGNRNRVYRAMW